MKRSYKYGLIILVAIWGTAMIALSPQFIAAHHETMEVLQAFDKYSIALARGQFQEAYQLCGSDFRTAMPFDKFVSVQKSLEAQFGNLSYSKRTTYEVHGKGTPMYWRAVIEADMYYEKKVIRFEFLFHKEGGRWVLYGYEEI